MASSFYSNMCRMTGTLTRNRIPAKSGSRIRQVPLSRQAIAHVLTTNPIPRPSIMHAQLLP